MIYGFLILLFSALACFFCTCNLCGSSLLFYTLFSYVGLLKCVFVVVVVFFAVVVVFVHLTDTIRCKNCRLQNTSIHELVCQKRTLNIGKQQEQRKSM